MFELSLLRFTTVMIQMCHNDVNNVDKKICHTYNLNKINKKQSKS